MDIIMVALIRGQFAQVCVEVDLSKSLLSKFRLKCRVRKIEYEGMHIICFDCGISGHCKDGCPDRTPSVDTYQGHGSQPLAVVVPNKLVVVEEVVDKYGKWMIVKKNHRKYGNRVNAKDSKGDKSIVAYTDERPRKEK